MKKLWLWGGLFVVLSLAIAALLWVPKIERIVVVVPKNSPVRAQAIAALLKPYQGARFLQFSLVSVQEKVKAHPWVDRVMVSMIWPGTLKVQVQPQIPVARWGERGLVNAEGEVFFPDSVAAYQDLLPLSAPDVQAAPLLLKKAQWLIQQTAGLGWHLTAMILHPGGSLETRWVPKRTIWLKAAESEMQFSRFLAAWPQVKPALREQTTEVDLRYSNGFTVK